MRHFRLVVLVAGALLAALSTAIGPARVQTSLERHVFAAQQSLMEGDFAQARTHAEMLLLARDIRVYLEGFQEFGTCAVREAMDTWTEALDGEVRFVETSLPDQADVVVRFARTVEFRGVQVGGRAQWRRSVFASRSRDWDYSVTANLLIRTEAPNGRPMSREALVHIALHELGHVLGLDDSKRDVGVMGRLDLRNPVTMPTEEEVAALAEMRSEARWLWELSTNMWLREKSTGEPAEVGSLGTMDLVAVLNRLALVP